MSADYLPAELRRARTNVVCFTDFVTDYNQVGSKAVNLPKSSSGRHLVPLGGSIVHHVRKSPGILGGDTDTNRFGMGHLPLSPRAEYTSSDFGSDNCSRGWFTSDRYSRFQLDPRLQSEPRRGFQFTLSLESHGRDLL